MAFCTPAFHRGDDPAMRIFAKGWSMNKDGPGHRRIYYLKGCNLRCAWCASPESISMDDQLLFYPGRTGESDLSYLCPHQALHDKEIDRKKCSECPDQLCRSFHHKALEWVGCDMSVDEVEADILQSVNGWGNCAGVTFGGGEPSLQAPQLLILLNRLHKHKIHTAFESNGVPDGFTSLVKSADLVITDLKAGCADTFKKYTGGDFRKVLEHHEYAAKKADDLLIRIPLITTINDSEKELTAMLEILKELNCCRVLHHGSPLNVELLKLHHFGESKYQALGIDYPASGLPPVAPETVKFAMEIFSKAGINVMEG